MKIIKNWPVLWVSQIWILTETAHYGWHLTPGSDAELICDGIGMLIIAMSMMPAQNEGSHK